MRDWGRQRARRVAIDLGTANTVVYERGLGVTLFEPSVVAVDERSGEVYAVGEEARRMIGRTPSHIRATRPLRHGVISDFEVTEQMLRYFIKRTVSGIARRPEVMVCVPSGVTQVERSAVEEATIAAGARRVFLIDEPLAAAVGSGLPVGESTGSLIVDIGGGTTEMAVTALGGIVVSESIRTGGYDFDEAIVQSLQIRQRLLIGQEQAEEVKIAIGCATAPEGVDVVDVAGRDLATGLLRRAVIEASSVQEALAQPLRLILEALDRLLEATPPELAGDISRRGLTLVGGGALLRRIDDLIARHTGLEVAVGEEPLTAVARGAGRSLEELHRLPLPQQRSRARRHAR
jgi:rod shape-determining protein MreB